LTEPGTTDTLIAIGKSGGKRCKGHTKKPSPGKPLVSIVTVVLNDRTGLQKTIESVLNQTYDNIEYLVIDGGSTDGTTELLKTYDDRIDYWISEPDQGISDGFNKGISLATGEIVGIINAADWYEDDAVRIIVDEFLSSGTDIVHGTMQFWDGERKGDFVSANADLIYREMTLNHPASFVRRACYDKIGSFRTDFLLAMDYEWFLRARIRGLRFVFVESCLANMMKNGVSDKFWRSGLLEVLRAKQINNPRTVNYFYWIWQNVKGTVSHFLERWGMRWPIRYYHGHMSNVRKEKRDS
jgi:glycosyltransferase involved in cell wall biosynthesis